MTEKRNIFTRIIFQAAKLPVLYLLVALSLLIFANFDNYLPIPGYEFVFNYSERLVPVFLTLAGTTFLYNVITMIFSRMEKLLYEKNQIASLVLVNIRKSLSIIFILITINIIINILAPPDFYLEIGKTAFNILIICSIAWIALQSVKTMENVFYQRMIHLEPDEQVRSKGLYTKLHIIRNIATILIIILAVAAILMSFSSVRNIGISILASAGFLTAVVGIAGQRTLFSLFSSIQLAFSRAIKIGDIVVVENVTGMVEEITFTYVALTLDDQRRFIVPISSFIEKSFQNWSRDPNTLGSSIYLYVDYLMSIDILREELDKILKDCPYWDGKANKLEISNISERSVEIRIHISAKSPGNLSLLGGVVREKMLTFIRTHHPDHFPKYRLHEQE